ncbi:HAMP domain-containing sensor histidine kinase [Desulforamulus aeronauticus]|uniref:histidine kinase n=1 Tax=Desulforamulus aeronauticus DSM 10349 TaxID=1121421 RepID=A0A1M6TNP9_9FIRM|nr:HAMP domain-containing sensor histidine kinase [Desulforamulus aeronauticus]SHK58577.1 HAMP domain-containing protein [Desulforamulus aeronauticus DSM 10349]
MKSNRRVPLLQYWTTRYLITLCFGLLILGIISSLFIQYNARQKRIESIRLLATEIAESTATSEGKIRIDPTLPREIDRLQRFLGLDKNLFLVIMDTNRNLLFSTPFLPPRELLEVTSLLMENEKDVEKFTLQTEGDFYFFKQEIKNNTKVLGSVMILHPVREPPRSQEEFQLLVFMLVGLGLLGWGIIYLLTKSLAKPIKDVADAAKRIVTGDYNIQLHESTKEQEIYELIRSFKEMAERLRQMERMRTELLAGVTHELKTPVASISGLIQAVKDEVVTAEEAKEFLSISLKETMRLQHMVEDLLDFNSFVIGDISIHKERHNVQKLIQEITHQWLIGQEDDRIVINTLFRDEQLMVDTDAMRLQQILYNLFNNAKQVFVAGGKIDLTVYRQDKNIYLDVTDNGAGIPEEEQPLIFEKFFRGKAKKDKVRGLGLGLSFSKTLAKALGGDLILKNSSSEGTTFTLVLTV